MKSKFIVFVLLISACTLPDSLDNSRCTFDGESSLERRLNPGPDCNGYRHQSECAAANLPSAYGFEEGCEVPALSTGTGKCKARKNGLDNCISLAANDRQQSSYAGIICCPE